MGSWGEGASGGLAVGKLELRAFSSQSRKEPTVGSGAAKIEVLFQIC